MQKAFLIIGHGSSAKEANEMFTRVVENVRERVTEMIVEGAHMELCKPSIRERVEQLIERGVKEIILVPYFLYNGIHLQDDIPGMIAEMEVEFPQAVLILAAPIGYDPLLADLLIRRAIEAERQHSVVSQSDHRGLGNGIY